MTGFEELFNLLRRDEKRSGSDYTATVTRVKDGTAYVQITGAEITDTPVAMSVDAQTGDQVRVRINSGKAWLTGNDTRPPNNDNGQIEKTVKQVDEINKKMDTFLPKNLAIKKAIVYNQHVSLAVGENRIAFSLPQGFKESFGARIDFAWPLETWTNAHVNLCRDGTMLDGVGVVNVYSGSSQQFQLTISLLYV